MVTSKVYENIIPKNLINDIIEFYDQQPEVFTENNIINKNLEYHIPENFIFGALNPYMNQILGSDHEFSAGSYKSSSRPYIIHVDSRVQYNAYPDCMSFDSGLIKQNKAVLVPLVEGSMFRTVTFKNWSDFNPTRKDIKQAALAEKNHLLAEDFDHDKLFDMINYLPVDTDYHWHIGDILVWDRNQWHISSNFWKYQVRKTFLVLFMA
jgi:hypothetical protein